MYKGKHLLIDCREVPQATCVDDARVLDAMAEAARRAGATVIAQTRYRFGHNSPLGFAAVVLLDESHCSAHSYADLRLMALDIFTCGNTDPYKVLAFLQEQLDLGEVSVTEAHRFPAPLPSPTPVGGSGNASTEDDGPTFVA